MISTILDNANAIDILCLGTPSIHGDAIGPLVGSMLKKHSFDKDVIVIGSLMYPVTKYNYDDVIATQLREDALLIVVDATAGKRVWEFDVVMEPTNPGAVVNAGLEPIGDVSIKAYTGKNLQEIIKADSLRIALLAHDITTKLKDLLSCNKKGIYIEV